MVLKELALALAKEAGEVNRARSGICEGPERSVCSFGLGVGNSQGSLCISNKQRFLGGGCACLFSLDNQENSHLGVEVPAHTQECEQSLLMLPALVNRLTRLVSSFPPLAAVISFRASQNALLVKGKEVKKYIQQIK